MDVVREDMAMVEVTEEDVEDKNNINEDGKSTVALATPDAWEAERRRIVSTQQLPWTTVSPKNAVENAARIEEESC